MLATTIRKISCRPNSRLVQQFKPRATNRCLVTTLSVTLPQSKQRASGRYLAYSTRGFFNSATRQGGKDSESPPASSSSPKLASSTSSSLTTDGSNQTQIPLEDAGPKMQIVFTCSVADCGHRQSHTFSKRSYEKGIVLVQCPNCHNRHLIADHLGWFKNLTDDKNLTIEDLARASGERLVRGRVDENGIFEYSDDDASQGKS